MVVKLSAPLSYGLLVMMSHGGNIMNNDSSSHGVMLLKPWREYYLPPQAACQCKSFEALVLT